MPTQAKAKPKTANRKSQDKHVSVRVPAADLRAFEVAVEAKDLTTSQVLRKLIRAYLANPTAFTNGTSQREE